MAPTEEIARLLTELADELAEDAHNLDRISKTLRRLEGSLDPHVALLLALTGQSLDEAQAKEQWRAVRNHRADLASALQRSVPLRVALLDHLIQRNQEALTPDLIELRLLAATPGGTGTDPVTGLLTTVALTDHLQREVLRSKRFRTGFSVVLVGVDGIEDLADEIGELNLGIVERDVGLLLRNTVRDIDPAARLGVGRFGVLMPETDRTGAFLAADRLRQQVADHFRSRTLAGQRIPVTISGGVACFPEDAGFGAEVLRLAERALFQARSRGSDRISVHHRERREYIRIEVDPDVLRVDVMVRGEPAADATTEQVSRNISPQGVLFESPRSFQVGQEVSVVCSDVRDAEQIILPARVMRVEAIEADGEEPRFEVGLAFELTWEHQVQEILEFINRFRTRDGG